MRAFKILPLLGIILKRGKSWILCMKIAICGAGLVGSYLYRLLNQAGFEQVTIFDTQTPPNTSCGINPCAWGTSIGFEEVTEDIGLDPANYILQIFDSMIMNELKVKAKAMVIDKPKLIADLLNGVKVLRSPVTTKEFDRIIDATGFARAFLPPTEKNLISHCVQYRVSSRETHDLGIDVSNLGYAWRFPISRNEYHLGAGSVVIPPHRMLEKLGWLQNCTQICACTGSIRLTGPRFSLPFVDMTNDRNCPVWGVGEAIGCVAPLIGEGIIPGLISARLLLANWENPQAYQRAILKEFSWMKAERKLIDKAVQGKRFGLLDVQALRNGTKRFNIHLSYGQGSILLKSITKIG
jgi:flavin-dependent dehydrogenase